MVVKEGAAAVGSLIASMIEQFSVGVSGVVACVGRTGKECLEDEDEDEDSADTDADDD